MRQFRVAFIELMYRTVNVAEAEEIEMQLFGTANAVVRLEGQDRQNVEQANNTDNHNCDTRPQHENFVV